jgi:hypothetical protein
MNTQRRGKSLLRTIAETFWPSTGDPGGMATSKAAMSPLPTCMIAPISGYSIEVRKELTRISASLWILVAPTRRYGTSYWGFSIRARTRGTP